MNITNHITHEFKRVSFFDHSIQYISFSNMEKLVLVVISLLGRRGKLEGRDFLIYIFFIENTGVNVTLCFYKQQHCRGIL